MNICIEYKFVIEDSEFGIAHATVEKEKYDSLNEGDSIKTIITVGFLFKNLYVKSIDKDLSLWYNHCSLEKEITLWTIT